MTDHRSLNPRRRRLRGGKTIAFLLVLAAVLSPVLVRSEDLDHDGRDDATGYRTKAAQPTDLVRSDDGYEWPTLYEEADDMLDAAMLMYPMATLRKLAKMEKKGDLSMTNGKHLIDPDTILKEPATAAELAGALQANAHLIAEALGGDDKSETVMDALATIVERQKAAAMGGKRKKSARLLEFDDDNSKEELVYGLAVDDSMKRVTLGFRGSVTNRDFLQDAQIWLEEEPNPFAGKKGQPKRLGLHNGFHDYLFYNATADEGRPEQGEGVKFEIIADQVVAALKRHPGYKLYVTGHSLGGALSTLFAFLISARSDEDVPKPVTCVSIASPYVGDDRWKKAFQYAEANGLLRHLRVSNHKDLVTLSPFLSLKLHAYKHVGHNLKLFPPKTTGGASPTADNATALAAPSAQGRHRLIFPKVGKRFTHMAWLRVWGNSLLSNLSTKYLKNHGCAEYNLRLDACRSALDGMWLNDLYANRTAVGLLRERYVEA